MPLNPASSSQPGLHRRIRLKAEPGHCAVALEDDFHRFDMTLRHDGQRALGFAVRAERTPWTICWEAAERLSEFEGLPIGPGSVKALAAFDSKQQCTHQYDLTALLLSHAARGGERLIDAFVSDPVDGRSVAELRIDGALQLRWQLAGTQILDDGVYAGQNLRSMMPWALATLAPQALEDAFVLRRTCMVSNGRGYDLDDFPSALPSMQHKAGACFVFQPVRAERAIRVYGSTRKDVHSPDDLLQPSAEAPTGR